MRCKAFYCPLFLRVISTTSLKLIVSCSQPLMSCLPGAVFFLVFTHRVLPLINKKTNQTRWYTLVPNFQDVHITKAIRWVKKARNLLLTSYYKNYKISVKRRKILRILIAEPFKYIVRSTLLRPRLNVVSDTDERRAACKGKLSWNFVSVWFSTTYYSPGAFPLLQLSVGVKNQLSQNVQERVYIQQTCKLSHANLFVCLRLNRCQTDWLTDLNKPTTLAKVAFE